MAKESFVRGIAEHIKRQAADSRLEAEENQRKDRILKSEPPQKWAELKTWIREAVQQINQTQPAPLLEANDRESMEQVKILRKGLGAQFEVVATVGFFPQHGLISCTGKNVQGSFKPEVRGNEIVYLEESASKTIPLETVEALGERILSLALNYTLGTWASL